MSRNDVEALPDTKPTWTMPLLVFLLVVAIMTLAVVVFIGI